MRDAAEMTMEEIVSELVEVIGRLREGERPTWLLEARLWRLNWEAMYRWDREA